MKFLISIVLALCLSAGMAQVLHAQWIPSQGIDGANVSDLLVLDSTVFICAGGNGIYSRNINGGPWMLRKGGYPFTDIIRCGNAIVAWGYMGICYRSLDHGYTWQGLSIPGGPYTMCAMDSTLFCTSYSGLLRSDNYGTSFYTVVNNTSTSDYPSVSSCGGSSLFLYYGYDTITPIYESTDKGISWDTIQRTGLPGILLGPRADLCRKGSCIWISTEGTYRRPDTSQSWILVEDSIYFQRLRLYNGTLFGCSTENGFFRYDTLTNQWFPENFGLETLHVQGFSAGSGSYYVATDFGPYKCIVPFSWFPVYDGLYQSEIQTIAFRGNETWAVTPRGTFISQDHGASFTIHDMEGIPDPVQMILTDSVYYMISWKWFCYSFDHGSTWVIDNTGLPASVPLGSGILRSLAVVGDYLFIGTFYHGLYRSHRDNINWVKITSLGLPEPSETILTSMDSTLIAVKRIYTSNDHFYTVRSTDFGATFSEVDMPIICNPSFSIDGDDLFALSDPLLRKSSDEGATWSNLPCGPSNLHKYLMSANSPAVIIGGSTIFYTDIYLSATYDNGMTWYDISGNLPHPGYAWLSMLTVDQQRTFVSPGYNGLWYQDGLLTGIGQCIQEKKDGIRIIPNPARTKVLVEVSLEGPCLGNVFITNSLGRRYYSGPDTRLVKGKNRIPLDVSGLEPGMYIVSLRVGTGTRHRKLLVTR